MERTAIHLPFRLSERHPGESRESRYASKLCGAEAIKCSVTGTLPGPVMRRGTGFKANAAGIELGEEACDLAPLQLLLQDRLAFRVEAVNGKTVLCDIETDGANLRHGGWLLCWTTKRTQHGTKDAIGGRRPPHHRNYRNLSP